MSMIQNQIRNIVLRKGLKDLQGDERRKELDQSLSESTMGAQLGVSTASTIRGTTSFFDQELKNTGRAAYDFFGRGVKGKIARTAARYGATAMLISQAAELPANLLLGHHIGRETTKPHAGTGPVTVALTSAILPLGVISLGASAIHPSLGKPVTKINESALSWLRGWVRSAGRAMPEPQNEPSTGGRDRDYPDWRYKPPHRGPMRWLQQGARKLEAHIDKTYTEPEDAQILKGMLLSGRHYLSKDLLDEFDKTGQSHVLAFSGLHASILGMYFLGAYKALTAGAGLVGRAGGAAIQRIRNKTLPVSDMDLERQRNDAKQLGLLLRRAGSHQNVQLPFRSPRTMAEYVQNQRYLHSVDPDISPESRNQNQMKRIMETVTRRFAGSQPATAQSVQPTRFRQPRQNLSPVLAPWDNVFTTAVWQDEPDLQGHLLALKYDKMRDRVQPLIKHMLSNLPEGFDASQYDVIVPVPLHRQARKKRGGYNQTELLAKGLSKELGVPVDRSFLKRSAPTEQQSKQTRAQRRAGIQESVRVDNASRLYGKRVLLLDDLITTGTTAEIMTRKLRQAGAGGVDVMALARSDRDFSMGSARRGMTAMDAFLGISLLSGRNEPRYALPRRQQGGQVGRQRQIVAEQRRVLANQQEYEKDLRNAYRQLVNRYGQERGSEMYRQQSRIMRTSRPNLPQLQERADRAMDTIAEAQSYYNAAQAQNVSIHLGYGGSEPQWVGSGTYVAPGQVVTAEHAVRGVAGGRLPRPSHGYVRNLDTGLVEFPITQVLLEDAESDVALLETVAHRAQQAARPGTFSGMRVDPSLRIVGADLHEPGSELFDPSVGYRREQPARYMAGMGRGRHTLAGYGQQGMSGGAMYDSLDRMVGMSTHARQGRTVSGPGIEEIQRVLAGRRNQDAYGLQLTSGQNEPMYPYSDIAPEGRRQRLMDYADTRQAREIEGFQSWVNDISQKLANRGAREIGPYPSDIRQYIFAMQKRLGPDLDKRRTLIDTRADRLRELAETATGVISPEAADYYSQAQAQNVSINLGMGQQPAAWRGSGTFIAPGKVLTARHVAAELERGQPSAYREPPIRRLPRAGVVRNLDEGRVEFPIQSILHLDDKLDMALLQVPEHGSQRPAVFGPQPTVGQRFTATGADLYTPDERLYDPSESFKRVEEAVIQRVGGYTRGGGGVGARGYIQGGMSGGGWFDEQGRLIGLNSISIGRSQRGFGDDFLMGEPHQFAGPDIDAVYESLMYAEQQGFPDRRDLQLTSGRATEFFGGREPFQTMEFAKTLDPTAVREARGATGALSWIASQMIDLDARNIEQLVALERELDPILRREIQGIYDSTDAEKQGWIRRYEEYEQGDYRDRVTGLQEQVLKEVDGAIFKIAMHGRGSGAASIGTGFSPAPGQLLTNLHVIQPPRGEEYLFGEATRLGSGPREHFDFTTFLGADAARDTALLRIPEGFEHTSIPFAAGDFDYRAGTQVAAPGMPGSVEGMVAGIIQRVTPGFTYQFGEEERFRAPRLHTDLFARGGLSGSPILARTAEGLRAIAQHHSSYREQQADFLMKHGVSTPATALEPWIEQTMANLSDMPEFLSSLRLTSGRNVEPIVLPSGMVAAEHVTENIEVLRRAGAVTPAAQTGQTQLSVTGLHRFARDPESAFFSAYPSYRHRFPTGFAFDPEMLVGEFGGAVRERPFQADMYIERAVRDITSEFEAGYRTTGVPDIMAGGPVDRIIALENLMGPGGEILDTPARELLEYARMEYDDMRVAEEMTGQQAMEYLQEFSERATRGAVARPYPEIVVDRPVPLSRAYGEFTDPGFRLTSGRADFDRHPNVFYSPLTERQIMGEPVRDTDPGNYQYVLEKIMGARTREEVERILEPIHRTYDPKRGVQFAAGQLGVNRASQLLGSPQFRGRGTVFHGEHVSDTLSRQGSLVLPQEILATGGPRALGLEGLEPEIWQPRRGFAGAASLLPLPGDTDITQSDVIKHIRGLPTGTGERQLPLFERQRRATPSRAVDTARAQQLKLLSGRYDDMVAEQLQFIHTLQPRTPAVTEPLGRGLEGRPTYGFELEFFSEAGLEAIEDVLGPTFDIVMDYDSSLEEVTGSDNDELVANIFENLVEQFRDAGLDEGEIMDMAREEADDVSYDTRRDRELISPVYRGEGDIFNVQGILEGLEQFAPYINESAGMHVHVGSEGLTPENYINLLGNYMQRERVIDMVHDPQRRGVGPEYARSIQMLQPEQLQMPLIKQQAFGQRGVLTSNLAPMTYDELSPINRTVMERAFQNYMNRVAGQYAPHDLEDSDFRAFRRRLFPVRYQKLNIKGHEFQTVEYRQPASTLDPQRIEQQIRFITNFVDRFKDVPFTPQPERNIAETFQELGFQLSEVQDPGSVERLQAAGSEAGIDLLSGRNIDQDLYDTLIKAQEGSKYTFDVGEQLTQDQIFDALEQYVKGVEDYFGFSVRQNPYTEGGVDVFRDSEQLKSIWYDASSAGKAILGRDTTMPPTSTQNFGYALKNIRAFFERYGTIGAEQGLSPELQQLIEKAQDLPYSHKKGEVFTDEQRTAVLTQFVEGVEKSLGRDVLDPDYGFYTHITDELDQSIFHAAKQAKKGLAGEIGRDTALDPARSGDFGYFMDDIAAFFQGDAQFAGLGQVSEAEAFDYEPIPPPEKPLPSEQPERVADEITAQMKETLAVEEQRTRDFNRKRFGPQMRQPYAGFDAPSHRSTDREISLEEYQRLESGDAPIFYRRMTGSDDISKQLGMFAGRDDNMRSFMKELYESVAKDVLGVRQGMRELRRAEVDAAMAYLDEWLPDLLGGFMTVGEEVTGGESVRGFKYNYRHGMFGFPTLDALADYTYGSGDILAMRGNLAGSLFQGNMLIDDYKQHPLEILATDLEVVGRYSRHTPDFVKSESPP